MGGAEVTTTISHSGNGYMYVFTSSGDCVVAVDVTTSTPMFVTLTPYDLDNILGTNCTQLLRVDEVSYNDKKWNLVIWRIDDMSKECDVGCAV